LLRNKWTSYQKARLNCSLSGAFPSYFDVIRKSLLEPCSSCADIGQIITIHFISCCVTYLQVTLLCQLSPIPKMDSLNQSNVVFVYLIILKTDLLKGNCSYGHIFKFLSVLFIYRFDCIDMLIKAHL
jgi:hypothetical protein